MTVNEGISVDRQPAAPIGEARSGGPPAFGRAVPGAVPQEPGTVSEDRMPERPQALRIGDKVRSLVDDVCVSAGLAGLVVNVVPPRYGAPARARILWDNETVSMADSPTFEVLGGREIAADQDSKVA